LSHRHFHRQWSAPLLCAGVTTYNALRNAGLRGGDLVAVQGIGGLGHLGVQFARQMGFRTIAIGRGREKQKLAQDLGAHLYIDAAVDDAAAVLQRMGGAPSDTRDGNEWRGHGAACCRPGSARQADRGWCAGRPNSIKCAPLIFDGLAVYGTPTGTPMDSEDTLAFSVLENIRPMIETVPLEKAADGFARMMAGKARFRMVLVTKNGMTQTA
jgi:alcohol dehydrogenase, propanol-preferring